MYSGPLQDGLTLVLAGYGASGNGNVGPSIGAAPTVKRTGHNTLDELTTTLDTSGLTSSFFVYDFDGPTGNGPLGGPTLGNAIETMVAAGDSGGPSFIQVGSSLQLLGINTFAAAPVANQPVTYTFGDLGGGIVAADPRFAAWLQATTAGTMPPPTEWQRFGWTAARLELHCTGRPAPGRDTGKISAWRLTSALSVDVAHIIQLAVAPVFLLSGVGVALTLFTNRLARIVDRARMLEDRLPEDPHVDLHEALAVLAQRARYINYSMALGTISGLLVTTTVILLFTAALLGNNMTLLIAVVFSAAMLTLTASLLVFFVEVRYATSNLRIGICRGADNR